MREIQINSVDGTEILQQFKDQVGGELVHQWGESVLKFDNTLGEGMIRSLSFDWGISLIDYDVQFIKDTKIVFTVLDQNPIEFIFISEGSIRYSNSEENKTHTFERYQNIIVSSQKNSKEVYYFPEKVPVKANFIYLLRKEYKKKKNNNVHTLENGLLKAFKNDDQDSPYQHFGNFSLKIADHIKQLQESYDSGIVRTLTIEGQLNLIMALQMLEQSNHAKGKADNIPESLSKNDIKIIHDVTAYLTDNISEPITIALLVEKFGITSKKLQLGFKVLYSKSVNEYIRHLKLEIARDHINNTDDTISEIVYHIGLKSRSYFSKIFFERYGILPIDYRKKNH